MKELNKSIIRNSICLKAELISSTLFTCLKPIEEICKKEIGYECKSIMNCQNLSYPFKDKKKVFNF